MTDESEIGDNDQGALASDPGMRMEFASVARFCDLFFDGRRQDGVQSVTIRAAVNETTTAVVERRVREEPRFHTTRTTYVIERGEMTADLRQTEDPRKVLEAKPEEKDYSEGGYKEFWWEFAGLYPGEKSPTEVMVAGKMVTHSVTDEPLISLQGDCGGVDLCRYSETVGWPDLFRTPYGTMVAASGEVMRPEEGRLRVMVRHWAVRPGPEVPPLFFRKGHASQAMVRDFLMGTREAAEPAGTGFDAFHREFADVQPGQATEIEVMVAGRSSESWRTRWPAPVPLLPGWSDPEGLAITLRDLDNPGTDSRGADLFCGDWTKSFPALLELRKDALLAASGTVFRTTGGRLGVKVRYWAAANPDRSSPPSRSYTRSHATSEEMVRAFLKGDL